jgi:glyoxylase-like metal-dependent hydrolase (beta-lactamase superfamily II)
MKMAERISGIAVAVTLALAGGCSTKDLVDVPPPSGLPRVATVSTPSGLRISAVLTGWVGVKEPHWRYRPPSFLVVPRVFLSGQWHEWIPNLAYVVIAGGKALLVDTGADPAITNPSYMDCDPSNAFFYRHNMRFVAKEEDTVDRRLPDLGLAVDDVQEIVITHFHADHPGRLAAFPRARVLTGRGNWPSHVGSVPCVLPPGFSPEFAEFTDGPFGAFDRSQKLLGRDDVRLVPMFGHTPGHVGVMVRDGDRYWLIAGDATFNREETEKLHVCGVSEDVDLAIETQKKIREQLAKFPTALLPAHDPDVLRMLPSSAGPLAAVAPGA